jgi:DNA-binding protein YbaB
LSVGGAGDRLGEVLAGLRGQLVDFAAVQKEQAALCVEAQAAGGSVEVTVNARGQLVKAVVDESFLDGHDVGELGGYIVEAAQCAARDAQRRVAEMLAPINERHRTFPSFAEIVEGVPDLGDVMPPGLDVVGGAGHRDQGAGGFGAGGWCDDGEGGAEFPTVRR